ncbi:MAG: peptide chain release factor 2 [Candidatus Aminicenantia bacterium]
MELGEAKKELEELKRKIEELRGFFEINQKKAKLEEINKKLSEPDIWSRPKEGGELSKLKKDLEETINIFENLKNKSEEIEVFIELGEEGEDVEKELEEGINKLKKMVDEVEITTLFFEEDDKRNAILTIHPGAGGTESQDWAQMLMRMYLRFCDERGFKTEIVDYQPGEEAGIKSVTIRVEGKYAYGHLSSESGVHRLVRISPFDANKRRHTSFSAVFVYPEIEDDIEVEIRTEDLKIETFRSSGKGGQHVNVTDSAVRITHIPTGIVVSCQNERSQHKNREIAMKILRSRLYELERRKRLEKIQEIEDSKGEIAWGNQIRSYVLQPYQKITDHRTKIEIGDVQRVMDGDLDELIRAYLILRKIGKERS